MRDFISAAMFAIYVMCAIVFAMTLIQGGEAWWEAILVSLYWPVVIVVVVVGEHML